jgi:hypothetical protein
VEPLFSLCILSQSHRNNREGSAGIPSPLGGGGEGVWMLLVQYVFALEQLGTIYGITGYFSLEAAKNLK